jgi:hypothetical protein
MALIHSRMPVYDTISNVQLLLINTMEYNTTKAHMKPYQNKWQLLITWPTQHAMKAYWEQGDEGSCILDRGSR